MRLKIGDSIENIDKYEGEGELIIADVSERGLLGVIALNKKYPDLNGQPIKIDKSDLKYYKKV